MEFFGASPQGGGGWGQTPSVSEQSGGAKGLAPQYGTPIGEGLAPGLPRPAWIRRAIYTTNAIESLNSTVRRAVRTRGHFRNDRAATKLIYLALGRLKHGWRAPPLYWHQVRPEFAIRVGERFVVDAA